MNTNENIYGLMAEFGSEQEILTAAHSAFGHGYRNMDAFVPFPVNGLPEALGWKKISVPKSRQPFHPLFDVPELEFEDASSDMFFLYIEADDPKFDLQETRRFLEMLKPESITEVPINE